MVTRIGKDSRNNTMRYVLFDVLPYILILLVCAFLCSCGENKQQEQRKEIEPDSVDRVDEGSHADSVTSEYLDEMIHSGHKVLLNFCYCCDCKITKPLLQTAIEKLAAPISLVTVDVKEHFDLADEYGVKQSPFYILFDETGLMVDTLYGYEEDDLMDSKKVQSWLQESVLKAERKMK